MPKYDLCLFDLDGTLTDSKPGIINSIIYALDALDRPAPLNIDTMLGPPLWQSFVTVCGIEEDMVDLAVTKYREYFNKKGMLENSVYPGILELIKLLRDADVQLAVATSKPEFYARKILKHFEIDQYFDFIAGSEMDGRRSNKADVIAYAMENFEASNPIMIGDRKHDIIGANNNGFVSIGVLWGYGGRLELEEAGATYVVSTTNEIQNIVFGV